MTETQIPSGALNFWSRAKTIDISRVQVVHERTVDLRERYYELSRLGRETFCASVAQAMLVRTRPALAGGSTAMSLGTGSGIAELSAPSEAADGKNALLAGPAFSARPDTLLEFIPLAKKPGTPFVDLITIGRTEGNDILIPDLSVSRFQAFFRRRHGRWFVCDAGSSNGTRIDGKKLLARTEAEVVSDSVLLFGAVEFRFHTSDSLYDILAVRHRGANATAGTSERF